MHLIYTHESLENFDPNYKLSPPLREQKDAKALFKGIQDGTIDVINSNHTPLETEAKKLEFVYADFGIIGLQTIFALLNTHFGDKLTPETLVNLLAIQPRKILNLPIPTLQEGAKANLSIFDTSEEWTFSRNEVQSKSYNSPHIGTTFKGKIIGVINGNFSTL